MSETDRLSKDPSKRKKAVALAYNDGDHAPRVVAQGQGEIAQKILEAAAKHDIYVHNSAELTSLLMQVDLDSYIPEELYQVIAELLVWVQQIERSEST